MEMEPIDLSPVEGSVRGDVVQKQLFVTKTSDGYFFIFFRKGRRCGRGSGGWRFFLRKVKVSSIKRNFRTSFTFKGSDPSE
jgi:hypothetical protein